MKTAYLLVCVFIVLLQSLPCSADNRDWVAGDLIILNDNAGWCWYQDEKIIYDPAQNTILACTTANHLGVDGKNRNANIDVVSFSIATGQCTLAVMGNKPYINGKGDDHNMGALWRRPDGRYIVMYAIHNDASRNSYYRISTNPGDACNWQPEQILNWQKIGDPVSQGDITYSNLLYLSAEGCGKGRLYNIARGSKRSPNIAYSDDWGQSWKYGGKLSLTKTESSYSNGYYKFNSNNIDRIDFLCTEHHPRNYNTSIYHGYIKAGKSYNSLGKIIDSNIFDENAPAPEDFSPVFLSSPEDGINDANEYHRAWTVELERGTNGNSYTLFTTRFGTKIADSLPGDADHRLFYASFDNDKWQFEELAKMGPGLHKGEQDYTGLGTIHPDDPNLIYISTVFDPRDNKILDKHEIFKGIRKDNKWHWSQITKNSTVDNIRPAIPKWDSSHTAVFWLRGDYPWQWDYKLALVGIIK